MDFHNFWFDLMEFAEPVADFDWSPEYFSSAAAGPIFVLRVGTRFLVMQERPEHDLDMYPRALLPDAKAAEAFVEHIVQRDFRDVEGVDVTVYGLPKVKDLPDVRARVSSLADQYWSDALLEESQYEGREDLIRPSQVIHVLTEGQGLRPSHPEGFVVDADDRVLIQDGLIWFSPVGGLEKYYSSELSEILDSIGIKVVHQRLVMNIPSACPSARCDGPENFARWFEESSKYLRRREVLCEIKEAEAEIAKAERAVQTAKNKLAAMRQELEGLAPS